MTVAPALHALHMGKYAQHGIGGRPGRWARPRSFEAVKPAVLAKLRLVAALHAAEAEAADRARGESE